MPISHKNCYEETYFLHVGKTKSGKPKYFMSKTAEGNLAESIPDGYEIFERPGGLVVIRKSPKTPILPHELKYVQDKIATIGRRIDSDLVALYRRIGIEKHDIDLDRMPICSQTRYEAEVRGETIIVYEVIGGRATALLEFALLDEDSREYRVSYWYIGNVDRWRSLQRGQLQDLADKYSSYLGREYFYEREC